MHAELGPFAPPPTERLHELNRAMLARAAAMEEARARWRIGEPYRGADLRTLVVRRLAQPDNPPVKQGVRPLVSPGVASPGLSQRVPLAVAAAGALVAVAGAVAGVIAALAVLVLVPAGLGWAVVRLSRAQRRLPVVLPLDRSARAIVDAYRELGEMSEAAAGSLEIEPRASGYLRCLLTAATPEESVRFADALDELASVADAPRYLVGRPLPDPDAGAVTLLGRVLRRQPPFPLRHHPVPKDLGRNKERAEAFERAWARHVGGGGLVFTQRTDEGRRARAEAAAHDGGYETLLRDVWV